MNSSANREQIIVNSFLDRLVSFIHDSVPEVKDIDWYLHLFLKDVLCKWVSIYTLHTMETGFIMNIFHRFTRFLKKEPTAYKYFTSNKMSLWHTTEKSSLQVKPSYEKSAIIIIVVFLCRLVFVRHSPNYSEEFFSITVLSTLSSHNLMRGNTCADWCLSWTEHKGNLETTACEVWTSWAGKQPEYCRRAVWEQSKEKDKEIKN